MRRLLDTLIVLVVLLILAVGVMRFAFDKTDQLSQSEISNSISLEPIRIGQTQYHTVTLDIPRDVDIADVTDVKSSCGCAILSFWTLDKEKRTIQVQLETHPDAYTTSGMATILTIHSQDTVLDDVDVTSDIQSPFAGWPAAAQGSIDKNIFRLSIHGPYTDAPLIFRCYDKDDNEIEVHRPSPSEIMIEDIKPDAITQYTLVTSFAFDKTNPTTWAGPLAVLADNPSLP